MDLVGQPIPEGLGTVVDLSVGDDPTFETLLVQRRIQGQRWWLLYLMEGNDWRLMYSFRSMHRASWPQLDALEGVIVDIASWSGNRMTLIAVVENTDTHCFVFVYEAYFRVSVNLWGPPDEWSFELGEPELESDEE